MQHKQFEEKHPAPACCFFDADKQKYQLTNEAGASSEIELISFRRVLQQYNDQWIAFLP